jgi:hypothetical protein
MGVGGTSTAPVGRCAFYLAASFRVMEDCTTALQYSSSYNAYAYTCRRGRSSVRETIIEYVLINLSSLVDRAAADYLRMQRNRLLDELPEEAANA